MPSETLGIFCPSNTCATSFYRAIGPLGALRKTHAAKKLRMQIMNEVNWPLLKMLDYAFMQRPYSDQHVIAAKLIKSQRIPLWIDYDDFLLAIPEDNPCHEQYNKPGVQKNIETLLGMADIVTVSTAHLGQLYMGFNDKIVVIQNAFDEVFSHLQKPLDTPQNKLIMWRGSPTHEADLDILEQAAVNLAQRHQGWTWLFLGCKPWYSKLMPKKNTIVIDKHFDIFEYHAMIAHMRPALAVVPLVNSDFNKAKSDCAFIEATFAGATVIAPDFQTEFSDEVCIKYKSGEAANTQLWQTIDKAMRTELPDLLAKQNKAWQYIERTRLLSQANNIRADVLDHLRELRNAR